MSDKYNIYSVVDVLHSDDLFLLICIHLLDFPLFVVAPILVPKAKLGHSNYVHYWFLIFMRLFNWVGFNTSQTLMDTHGYSRTLTNTHGHSRILTDTHRYSQILTDTHGYSQILTDTHGYSRILTDPHRYSRTLTDTHGHSRILTDTHGYSRNCVCHRSQR